MNNPQTQTLQILSDLPGISGDEIEVRRAIHTMVETNVDTHHVDAMGNLITYKRGAGELALRVLITAHMDEVGLMVTGHTSEGALRVHTVGGINAQVLPGTSVLVGKDKLPGIIGLKSPHRASSNSFVNVPGIDTMAVDVGANKKDEAEQLAPLGTPITFSTKFKDLGHTLTGKAFDDRAGCATLVSLLQSDPLPFELYGVFTVQEEVGLRGAMVASYTVKPDIAISLEGTLADDLPKKEDEKDTSPTTKVGQGPAITVMDRSYITPPWLLRMVIETAKSEKIPYQLKQPGISGTEAGATHRARGGVPAITIAVPCRYIHSPISLLRKDDLIHTYKLVQAVLQRLTPDLLRRA